jgi:protein tyrosine phosphatase
MALVVVSFQIDQRLAVLTVLELFKQLQVANIQSVQAVQQYVAVSDVLEETGILVL